MAKHTSVTVHPPREREIVIEAGMPHDDAFAGSDHDGVALDTAGALDAPGQEAPPQQPLHTEASAPPAPVSQSVKAARSDAEDGYAPTTLEDLKGTPMSRMQKAIIVVAVLGIVVFAIWYLVHFVIVAA